MKFYQFLLLLFIFVFSIFGDPDVTDLGGGCKRSGSCARRPITLSYEFGPYRDKDSPCYYYACQINKNKYMAGSGKYEDFINTCKYVDPNIKKEINSSLPKNDKYVYQYDGLIVAVCPLEKQEECEKIMKDKESEYINRFRGLDNLPTAFDQQYNYTPKCEYDNTPLAQLPQVQCDTGGTCTSGSKFYLGAIKYTNFVTKTCDACVMFVCSVLGNTIIEGTGCYDDFVKACGKVNPSAVEEFKGNIKNNFYHDPYMMVASCSDADNCHKYAFDNYNKKNIFEFFIVNKVSTAECSYEEIMGTASTTPEISTQSQSHGITSMKLFFGIYFLLVLIY